MVKLDLVVCSKDRPDNLAECIPRFSKQVPHDSFYVFEGSLNPNKTVLNRLEQDYGVKVVYVPGLKFGAVRALIMEHCSSDYVAMVDDDIFLSYNWLNGLLMDFEKPDVVAISSKLIYGDGLVRKLSMANLQISGGSGGAALYNRKAVLALGNFNSSIHRGEDMELELRIQRNGKRWLKSQKVYAYHPVSLMDFLNRPKANVCGWNFIMSYSKHKYWFITKRFASTFVMPVYYFWHTFDLRVAGFWFIYKMKALLYYLSGKYST
jgi:glycosyltransferase involved in cell wall biosynthesis